MKKFYTALLAMAAVQAMAAPVGIASGGPAGTNYAMVEDIRKMCSTPTSPIRNQISTGSIDNIDKVYTDKTVQYGVVQADAAEWAKGQDKNMMAQIKMVFPFFSTEIHLIVKDSSNIKSLADLEGKRVIEGPDQSGTWVTVQLIKRLTGMKWQAGYAGIAEGTKAVIDGGADAEFIVAGAPISALMESKGYRVISISHPALDTFGLYTKARISSGTYPGQTAPVTTYKMDNILITFAFANQYQKEIAELTTCITSNIGRLQTEPGFHPKWRDVTPLDIDRIQWPSHPAAVAAIRKAAGKK